MVNHPNRARSHGVVNQEFAAMFPGVEPDAGTYEQWMRLVRHARASESDLKIASGKHTWESHRWERIADAAKMRAAGAADAPDHAGRLAYIVQDDVTGFVARNRHAEPEKALAAALRRYGRDRRDLSVIWCDLSGKPKTWVAHVTARGVKKTQHWGAAR